MHITIKEGMKGFVVYVDGNPDRFYTFNSDEYLKLLEFVGKLVVGNKVVVKLT